MDEKDFLKTLEDGIAELPQAEQAKIFRPCAENCAKGFVLTEMRRQFEECGSSLDEQYKKYGNTEFFYADIIEPGHVYEMGYPRCLCPLVEAGFVKSAVHCECSRQSIIFVLQSLLPDKEIEVETIETVLSGATKCKFRVTIK
jgi:hypothetical protein